MERVDDVQLRHNSRNDGGTNTESGWKCIAGLFIVQFLFSQLFFSYGMYTVYLENDNIPATDTIWASIIFLVVYKFFKPWCRDIAETFHEGSFRSLFLFGNILTFLGITANFFHTSFLLRNITYGGLAGFGTTICLCLVESKIFDLFQYQSALLYSIKYICAALGLFSMPHLINFIIYLFPNTKYIYMFHGAILLHAIPASYLFGRSDVKIPDRFSRLSELWLNPEKRFSEVTGVSELSRSWKSPSDNVEKLFASHEDLEHEVPAPHQKCTAGIEVLPKIEEENEEEPSEETKPNVVNKDIHRLSIISTKLEVLIDKHQEEAKHVEVTVLNANNNQETVALEENVMKFQDRKAKIKHSNPICCSCCSPYQKFRYRRRIKKLCDCLIGIAFKPLISSCKIPAFYPCLLSTMHSMFSPLVFLNFMPVMAKEDSKFGNVTEVSFMLSITAFAYICFLLTIPWVADISKRNLRYLYIFGLGVSAMALYLIRKSITHDYATVSCLFYGFGMGIEQYCFEIVGKEYLGVKNWTKTEGTIDSVSGLLLIPTFLLITNFVPYNPFTKTKFIHIVIEITMYSHLLILMFWVILPTIEFVVEYKKKQKRNINRYSFLQGR